MSIDRKKFFMLAMSMAGCVTNAPPTSSNTTPVENTGDTQPTDERAMGGGEGDQCVAWDEMTGECTQWAPAGEAYGGYQDQCVAWDEMTGECTQWAPAGEQSCVAWDEMTGECTSWAPAGEGW